MKKLRNSFQQKPKFIWFVFTVLNVSSCGIEDLQEWNKDKSKILMQKTTLENLGYSSYKIMFNDGWKLLFNQEIQLKRFSRNEKNEEYKLEKIKEKITTRHLEELGYYSPFVYWAFWYLDPVALEGRKREFELRKLFIRDGQIPDGICINDYRTKDNNYQSFLWLKELKEIAYIETGTPKIVEEKEEVIYDDVLEYTWFINKSEQEDQANLNYTITKTKGVYWENTGILTISVGGKVGIPLLSEGSVTVTMGYMHTKGESETMSEAFGYTYWVKLPPKTKRQIVIRKKTIQKTIKSEIPVIITGHVAANFDTKLEGHYFHRFPANLLLKNKPSVLAYDIQIWDKGDIEIYGGPEIPL